MMLPLDYEDWYGNPNDRDGGETPVIIAIDYDGTYTADVELWDLFIRNARENSHEVHLVTCRRDTVENREEVHVFGIPRHRHHFTGLAAKKWFMEQKGIKVDIWIDDNPDSITKGM